MPWSEHYETQLDAVIARSQESFDTDPRSKREVELYDRSQAIKREQRRKRALTTQINTPNLDPEERDRLRRLRAAANARLIQHNREQRAALPGWR